MKRLVKKVSKDIFFVDISIAIIFVSVMILSQDLRVDRCFIGLLGSLSAVYHWKCFKYQKLDRSLTYNKAILLIREIVSVFASMFLYIAIIKLWPDSLPSLPKEEIADLGRVWSPVLYFITYKFLFSLLAIIIGIKLSTLLLLFLMLFPILILIGGFDVKYWAAITGLLGIWNYINSKDFVLYLRKGKNIVKIPAELEFKWQRNKLFATLGTVIFYCSLVISSFFEKKEMLWVDRINPRLYSLLGLTVFLTLSYLFILVYDVTLNSCVEKNLFMKLILLCGKKLRLDKLEKTINLYKLAKNKK